MYVPVCPSMWRSDLSDGCQPWLFLTFCLEIGGSLWLASLADWLTSHWSMEPSVSALPPRLVFYVGIQTQFLMLALQALHRGRQLPTCLFLKGDHLVYHLGYEHPNSRHNSCNGHPWLWYSMLESLLVDSLKVAHGKRQEARTTVCLVSCLFL